jgi:hypothetical protein
MSLSFLLSFVSTESLKATGTILLSLTVIDSGFCLSSLILLAYPSQIHQMHFMEAFCVGVSFLLSLSLSLSLGAFSCLDHKP